VAILLGLAACGDDSSSSAISDLGPTDNAGSVVGTMPTSAANSQPISVSEVAGPLEFFFIVDGPLVTNGPPWNCVTAGTSCDSSDANFGGTIELLDDCIVVQGSDSQPGSKSVVIFRFGVTWDEATQTILGLGPEPVAIGDEVSRLADSGSPPDAWTQGVGLPDVPDKLRECMRTAGTDSIYYNQPFMQVGAAPLDTAVPSLTTAPPGP
jgi:hypothetical protein